MGLKKVNRVYYEIGREGKNKFDSLEDSPPVRLANGLGPYSLSLGLN